jgi:inward rectifier potassium channel
VVASVESMFGLMGFAFATGLLYGRFSHPNAKILFSKNAIIALYRDKNAFEFRIANARKNQLIDVEVQVFLTLKELVDGKITKQFYDLELGREKVNFFVLSWTVVHPIDKESPLIGLQYKDLIDSDVEFLILLKAFDDTFSQSVHTRFSYKFNEIIWGTSFKNIFVNDAPGITAIDLDKLREFKIPNLPAGKNN